MLRGMPSLDPYREQAVQVCTGWGWGAGAEKPAESHGDRARLPEARDFSSQRSLHQRFMQDFLQIKALCTDFLLGPAVCAFQDKASSWLLPAGSRLRTSERVAL